MPEKKYRNIGTSIAGGLPRELVIGIVPPTILTWANGKEVTSPGKVPARYDMNRGWLPRYEWQHGISEDEQSMLDGMDANAGLILGAPANGRIFLGVDVDTKPGPGEIVRDRIIAAVQRKYGSPLLIRKTAPHKSFLLFAIPVDKAPGRKVRMKLFFNGTDIGFIEILTFGQQAVIAGMHQSGNRIKWHYSTEPEKQYNVPPVNWFPQVPMEPDGFLSLVHNVADAIQEQEQFGVVSERPEVREAAFLQQVVLTQQDMAAPNADSLIRLLNLLPHGPDVAYEQYVNTLIACAGAVAGLDHISPLSDVDRAGIRLAVANWGSKWKAPGKPGSTQAEELMKWDTHFCNLPVRHLGWPNLCRAAMKAGITQIRDELAQADFETDAQPPEGGAAALPFPDRKHAFGQASM